MTMLVPIMMFGWVPVTFVIFLLLPPRRAATTALIAGWLLLPVAVYKLAGIPDYDKTVATCLPVLLSTAIFDPRRLLRFRPRLYDLPMLAWCLCPLGSSVTNGLGVYDGVSMIMYHVLTWAVPYYLGRIYYWDLEGLRELALGIVVGALAYIPFCIWEIRMSPTLHYQLYGFATFKFFTTQRFGGYRPAVFMRHGIELGMWMTAGSLLITWLWWRGTLKQLWGISIEWFVAAQLLMTLFCKSFNGLALLVLGSAALLVTKALRTTLPIVCLLAVPLIYIGARRLELVTTDALIDAAAIVNEDRAMSLGVRLIQEEQLVAKALERPAFGWGGWGRSRLYNDEGENVSLTDGWWVIVMGQTGLVGLTAMGILMLLPTAAVCWRLRPAELTSPAAAPVVALAVLLPLYACDCLMNAMLNPIYVLAMGGLLGWVGQPAVTAPRQRLVAFPGVTAAADGMIDVRHRAGPW